MRNKNILKFENENLGMLRDGSVILQDHNEVWKNLFSEEVTRLTHKLGETNLKFYHIGSTAIPGIKAKPIIDIVATASTTDLFDQNKRIFEDLGYEYKGEYGISGRRFCVLYNEEKTKSYIHIHGFAENHPEVKKHLIFCDYLRSHPNIAKEYETLKVNILLDPKSSRSEYSNLKESLIQKILAQACAWVET